MYNFNLKTDVYVGDDCLDNVNWKKYGCHGLIITSRNAGKKSGALNDIINSSDVNFAIYDQVKPNPSLDDIADSLIEINKFKPSFIIAIGGGSVIDFSKCISVLMTNNIFINDLFSDIKLERPALPLIAIPTTCGSGSEVTPYANLVLDRMTKKSFSYKEITPVSAYIKPSYLFSLPYDILISSVLDSFCHAIEGYININSSPVTDPLSLTSLKLISNCWNDILAKKITWEVLNSLATASLLSGIVLSNAGSGFVHRLGYGLTMLFDIPHGKANALLLCKYLDFVYDFIPRKIDKILYITKTNIEKLNDDLKTLIDLNVNITDSDILLLSKLGMKQSNKFFSRKNITINDCIKIISDSIKS